MQKELDAVKEQISKITAAKAELLALRDKAIAAIKANVEDFGAALASDMKAPPDHPETNTTEGATPTA